MTLPAKSNDTPGTNFSVDEYMEVRDRIQEGDLPVVASTLTAKTLAAGRVLFTTTAGLLAATAEFLWDNVTKVLTLLNADLVMDGGSILGPTTDYAGASSYQPVGPDLSLAAGAGKDIGTGTAHLAPVMGNLLGTSLTKTGTYLAGVIGSYSVQGVKATHLQAAALLGKIEDTVTEADGAVVALIDGDSGVTKANAAFAYRMNNSTPGSGVDYGLDLHAPAHDGFAAAAILKADIRMSNQVVILSGAGAPVDGTTGDDVAGTGSIYIDRTNGDAYLQVSAISTPVWKLITRAA